MSFSEFLYFLSREYKISQLTEVDHPSTLLNNLHLHQVRLSITGFKWHKKTRVCVCALAQTDGEKQLNQQTKIQTNKQTNESRYIPQISLLVGERVSKVVEPLRPQLVPGEFSLLLLLLLYYNFFSLFFFFLGKEGKSNVSWIAFL